MRSLFLFALLVPAVSFANDLDHLRFGGAGEIYVPVPIENAIPDGDRLRIRSLELTTQASLDEVAPGILTKLTVGGEDSSGDLTLNIREGFISARLGNFDLRAGKFFLPVGILNQTRRTAWGMISAPRVVSLFFTEGGVVDTGADLAYSTDAFELRAGVTNGYRFDNSVTNTGAKPLTPTHFARPAVYFDSGDSRITLAADYVGRVADNGTTMHIAGIDASIAPAKDDAYAWQAQLEAYHRYLKPVALVSSEEIGGYLFVEKGLSPSSLVGVRFDGYKIPSLKFGTGEDRKNLTLALSPVYTYRGRDHLRFQVAYTYLRETRDGDTTRNEQAVEFRIVAEFGEIPKLRTPERRLDRSSL